MLARLRAPCKQDDHRVPVPAEVDPVARPEVQAQLQHTAADGLEAREVPGRDPAKGSLDSVGRNWIEPVQPSAERLASEATKVETRSVALSRRLGPGLPFGTPTAPASAPSPPSARVVPGPAWAACSAMDYLRSATGTPTHKSTQFP